MAVSNLNTGALAEQLGGSQILATAGESLRNSELAALEAADTFISPIPLAQFNTGALGEQIVGQQIVATAGDTFRNSFVLAIESQDSAAITGGVVVDGVLSAAEVGDDMFVGAATVEVAGAMAVAEVGDDTFAGAGSAEVLGALAAVEDIDALAGAGTVEVSAVFSAHEDADTANGVATVEVSGALSVAEAQDTVYVLGNVVVQGDKDASEEPDTASGDGDVLVQGTCDILEPNDTYSGVGRVRVTGAIAATEGADDIFVGQGIVINQSDIIERKQGRSMFRGITDAKVKAIGRRSSTAVGTPAVVVINPWTGVPEVHGHAKVMAMPSWTRSGRVVVTTGGGSGLKGAVARTTANTTRALGVAVQRALGRRQYAQAIGGDGTAKAYGGVHDVMFNFPTALGTTHVAGHGQFHVTSAGYAMARGRHEMPRSYKVVAAAQIKHRKVVDSLPL